MLSELWGCTADGTVKVLTTAKPSLLQSASCKDFWDHREKENLILLIENENPRSIYKTWRGSGCSLHDTEESAGQGPKTRSLLSIMLHTEKGPRLPEIVYIGYRCPPKSKFILLNCHGNTSCFWNHERERWGGFHVQTYIYSDFTNLIISKEEQDESSLLLKPDSPIRSTIPHSLEHHFCKIHALNGELRPLSRASKKSLWFNRMSALGRQTWLT